MKLGTLVYYSFLINIVRNNFSKNLGLVIFLLTQILFFSNIKDIFVFENIKMKLGTHVLRFLIFFQNICIFDLLIFL